jgi:hypothetical protein
MLFFPGFERLTVTQQCEPSGYEHWHVAWTPTAMLRRNPAMEEMRTILIVTLISKRYVGKAD